MYTKASLSQLFASLALLRKHESLLVICIVSFVSAGATGLLNPVLSLYVREYGVNTAFVGIFMTSFAVGRVLITIPSGRAVDRWGSKELLIAGALVEMAGAIGLIIATSYPQLVAARLVQGIGSGLFMSAAMIRVAELSSLAERGRFSSLYQASILLALTLTPGIGGAIANAFSIRATIAANVALEALVAAIVLWRVARHRDHVRREPSDSSAPAAPSLTPSIRAMLLNRNFMLIALAAFLVFVARSGARDTLLPLYADSHVGLDAAAVGMIFSLISLGNLVAIPVAGTVADRFGRKPPIYVGLLFNGLALLLITVSTSYVVFIVGALMMGVAKGLSEPTSMIYVADIAPVGYYGAAFGLFLTLRDLGLFVGPVILSWIADASGLQLPFLLTGGMLIVMTLLFWLGADETYSSKVRSAIELSKP